LISAPAHFSKKHAADQVALLLRCANAQADGADPALSRLRDKGTVSWNLRFSLCHQAVLVF
jgi:hypothetical protein